MSENSNTLLEKLDVLHDRFEEVSTLISDPSVISDQQRYVKLTREYKELERLMEVRKEYSALVSGQAEAKQILLEENDPEMREMAKEQAAECEKKIPGLEEHECHLAFRAEVRFATDFSAWNRVNQTESAFGSQEPDIPLLFPSSFPKSMP